VCCLKQEQKKKKQQEEEISKEQLSLSKLKKQHPNKD
jgi:hypothetical protein